MPFNLSGARVAYIAPYAYVLGGQTGYVPSKKVLKYHVKNNQWSNCAEMSI